MARAPFVVVAGNIASGKSTMANALAGALGVPAFLERPDLHPFISDFYADPSRWALASQLWFLLDTLEHQREAQQGGVQDHSAYENVDVYGAVLRERGELDEREYESLLRLQRFADSLLEGPDVIVLLRAPVEELGRRIALRGRDFEQEIDHGYLQHLAEKRDAYFAAWTRCPVLPVRTDILDPRRASDLEYILERLKLAMLPSD